MAGDLLLHEQAIILTAGTRNARALAAVEQVSGGVTHHYGERVIIAAAPPSAGQALRERVPRAALAVEAEIIPDAAKAGLSRDEALGLEAFGLRQSLEYKAAKAQRPLADEAWDSGIALQPDVIHDEAGATETAFADVQALPTSTRLLGRVAVGVIIVEGPNNNLKFSADERAKVIAEVQNGLSWLGSQSSPAGVSWFYDIQIITLNVQPGPANETLDQKEARWRDPAMSSLGYGPGLEGVQAYVEKLRADKGTDSAYCAFFTKYPIGWFAYASIGGPRLVMDYNNDGWGPDNIDRVFAHETGHVFNAPDEYKTSGCNCGGEWGFFKVANTNCEGCVPGGGVACIMRSNSWEMCAYTSFHLGFPQGQSYSGVFQAGTGNYGLWVNADWPSFLAKWQEWNDLGLRLDDIEISQPGGQPRYSGVFREGAGGFGLWVNADWTSFVAKWQEWNDRGLRLVDLEINQAGGELRYSGVFRQGSGGYGLWVNSDWPSFVAKWQEWSGQGMRLEDFTVSQVAGQPRYSGVFCEGTGGYGLWALADWSSFLSKWNEWSGQGLRLVDLEITKLGNETRYSGVYREGSGNCGLWVNADWSSFVARWNEWNDRGMRLIDFDINLTGIEVAASATAGQALNSEVDGGCAGYGFLSIAAAKGADEAGGAGMGAVSFPEEVASSPGSEEANVAAGAGMGGVSFNGAEARDRKENGSGLGGASFSAAEADNKRTDGGGRAGMGAASISAVEERDKEGGGAGRGKLVFRG